MISDFSSPGINELYEQLHSGEKGLSTENARLLLLTTKKNRQHESRFRRELKLLVRQFVNPMILLLIIAVILSAFIGDTSDTIIILSILLITGLLGFWQEMKAGRAVEQLQKMIQLDCNVLRDNNEKTLKIDEVVPGDIVILNAGDIVPADCRIVAANELFADERSVTGESYPAEKYAGETAPDVPLNNKFNCLWQGTSIVSGTAVAIAIATGADTLFGKMRQSLIRQPETAFERGIKHFGYFLLQITIFLSVVILGVNIYFGRPFFESLLFSLALAVGMAPELLPAIMIFAMSAGAKKMMKKKVIVKKLSSIFNFGEVNILCTDKTGTITEGVVKVKEIVNADGNKDDRAKLFAYLNASLQRGMNNPIDDAIILLHLDNKGYEKVSEIPYDFLRKRLTVVVDNGPKRLIITKGALQNVLDICSFVETGKGEINPIGNSLASLRQKYITYSELGYRVIGLCYKETDHSPVTKTDEKDMIFSGYILLEDPLKSGVADSIRDLRDLHVQTKIITGDNRFAALYTVKEIGISNPVLITGEELNKMSPEALIIRAAKADVFAEIEPYQKERIIKALQKSNSTVAYIGDGINDVAAIHAADTGISTNNAAPVAKEAADFVLLEKDLSVLRDGIYEGRKSFSNSLKYIFISTGATFGNMFSVAGASLILPFLPMLPKQILLTNFISDFPFLTVASDNVDEEELHKPGKWNLKVIRNFMIVFGLHSSVFDFITFYVLYFHFKLSGSAFQTGWFLESGLTELIIIFIIRTKKSFIKSRPGKFLLWSALIAFISTILLPVSPLATVLGLSFAHVSQVIALACILIAYTITADLVKILFFRFQIKRGKFRRRGV